MDWKVMPDRVMKNILNNCSILGLGCSILREHIEEDNTNSCGVPGMLEK